MRAGFTEGFGDPMPTIADLIPRFKAAGILVEVVPDFLTNGHYDTRTIYPRLGHLHHTVATKLVSVYKAPAGTVGYDSSEWRPTVPSPRCNLYGARARTGGCRIGCPHKGKAHTVFVSNGWAHQAGWANLSRIQAARAGRISAAVPDAAGLPDDYANASGESIGWEFDWNTGEDWPDDLLDMAALGMKITADLFWGGNVGHWIHHRQSTYRKPDMAYRGDIWARARAATPNPEEDALTPEQMAELKKYIHDQTQAAVQAMLKGGGNSVFKGLPVGEVTAVQQVEDKLDEQRTLLETLVVQPAPEPPA